MAYVLITHDVESYDAWKLGFDEAASLRKVAGEQHFQVLRNEQRPEQIVHFSKWQSIRQAKAFFESVEVEEIRKRLGVKAPEFVYLNELDSGAL